EQQTTPAQVRAHRARHLLGRLARRGRRLSCPIGGWRDEPAGTGGARRVRSDGVDRLVCARPAERRVAADRRGPVAGNEVGPDPALLGPGQAHDQCCRHDHPAVVHADPGSLRGHRRATGARQRRTRRAEKPVSRDPCRRRPAAVGRRGDAVGVQAARHDPLRTTQAAPAARGDATSGV
ncbi:MAG: hypothetical protein AVDCRST_MAG67-3539, partial [uncultured Solirubrobacteraceae bacterium]